VRADNSLVIDVCNEGPTAGGMTGKMTVYGVR
jgi:hypothetical protein